MIVSRGTLLPPVANRRWGTGSAKGNLTGLLHWNGSTRLPTQHASLPTPRNLKNPQVLAESKPRAHMTSSSRLKDTSRSGFSLRRAMEQRSDWPRTSLPRGKDPQYTGSSNPASFPSFRGTRESGTGNKRATWAMPPSSVSRPRGDTEMLGGSNIPRASSLSSNN